MNKKHILPWLLLGSMALSACGGGNAPAASGAASSGEDLALTSQPPARSAMAPIVTAPDVSTPATADPGDGSAVASQDEPDVSQVPDVSQPPEVPPATVTPAKPPKVTSKPQVTAEPQPASSEDPAASSEPDSEPESKPAASKETASTYIGKSVSSLIAAIGSPKGSDYAPSCLGDGEDGELFYDGFTVYTYRVNGTETVQDVV